MLIPIDKSKVITAEIVGTNDILRKSSIPSEQVFTREAKVLITLSSALTMPSSVILTDKFLILRPYPVEKVANSIPDIIIQPASINSKRRRATTGCTSIGKEGKATSPEISAVISRGLIDANNAPKIANVRAAVKMKRKLLLKVGDPEQGNEIFL